MSGTPMTTQDQLLEAFGELPPLQQQKVLGFVQRLQHTSAAPTSLYAKAKNLGAVGIVSDAPPDLSTNKDYLAGFGRD